MIIRYTKYYCEENIYYFLKDLKEDVEEAYAIFISSIGSPTKIKNHNFKNFDYHVVGMVKYKGDNQYYIWDFDSMITPKMVGIDYMTHHFGHTGSTPRFRIVPKDIMLNNFKTDRSHMTNPKITPPSWDKLHNTSNLSQYINGNMEIEGTLIRDLTTFLVEYIVPTQPL